MQVTKVMTFQRGSYLVRTSPTRSVTVGQALAPHAYFQLTRDGNAAEQVEPSVTFTFTGPAFFTDANQVPEGEFEDITDGDAKFAKTSSDGWVAMVQHYFVSAWLPEQGLQREFCARWVTTCSRPVILPVPAIEPGAAGDGSDPPLRRSAGQDKLEGIAPGPGSVSGLRLADRDRGAAVLGAAVVPQPDRQLGLGDHPGHGGEGKVLPAVGGDQSMAKMRAGSRLQRMKEMYGNGEWPRCSRR